MNWSLLIRLVVLALLVAFLVTPQSFAFLLEPLTKNGQPAIYDRASLLSLTLSHLAFETTVWPQDAEQLEAIIALGVGPVGAAFYAWDIGVKRGDIRLLGVSSYAAPVLSTAFLVLAGFAEARITLVLAALLIAGGGLLAAKDMLRRK